MSGRALRPLLRVAWGHARRRPLQSALLVLGVALGVAVVVAIDLANGSALRAFELSTEAVAGRATHRIVGGPTGLDEALYAALRRDPALDLRASAPVVEGRVALPALEGEALTLLGVDPFAEPPFRGFFGPGGLETTRLAALLTRRGTVLLSEELAARAGVGPGDPLLLETGGGPVEARVAGLLAPEDDLSRRALESLVLADVSAAQEILGRVGRLDRIDLLLDDAPEARAARLEAIAAALPEGARVEPAGDAQQTVETMTEAFRLNLTALSLLALLVGMFLIFNTVRFSIVQRRSTLATLRSLGVTRREIFAAILVEAALLGAIGALLGLGLGILLGRGAVALVTQTINDIYFTVSVRGVSLDPLSLARGAALGVTAALLAAALPAWEATSVPPVTALRRSSLEAGARRAAPRAVLLAGLCAALGLGLLAIPGESALLGLLALGILVFGFALLAPAATLLVMALVGPASGALFGWIGRMAPRDVSRALSRTAVAIAALMVALCVSIGVSLMVGSFRTTVERWLGDTLRADVFVSAPAVGTQRFTDELAPGLAAELAALPGVERYSTARTTTLQSPDVGPVDVVAVLDDIAGEGRRFLDPPGSRAPVDAAMAEGAVIVSEPFWRRHGLGRGDELRLQTDEGLRAYPIAGVYYDYGSERGTVLMRDSVYRRSFRDEAITSVALFLAPEADADAFARELRQTPALASRGELDIRSNRGLRQDVLRIFDRAFAITTALQVLAILVAFVGVLSALLALQLERARENATLRTTGMTTRQLGALSLLQTGLMGLVAGLLSWPAGLMLSLVLIYVINRRSFGWTLELSLEPGVFVRALAVALAAALLAGLWPAWRLSRQPIASALREE